MDETENVVTCPCCDGTGHWTGFCGWLHPCVLCDADGEVRRALAEAWHIQKGTDE